MLPNTEDGKVVSTAVFEGRSVESKAGTAGYVMEGNPEIYLSESVSPVPWSDANVNGSTVMSVRSAVVRSLSLSSL